MAAIPWKMRQQRSAQDRIADLSFEVRQLREELRRARADTLQTVCRRIERGKVSTLPQLKTQLVKQIEQMEEDTQNSSVGG